MPKNQTAPQKNKPLKTIRYGAVVASVWENRAADGSSFASVTLERLYKDESDQWRSAHSFAKGDLPNAVKALDEAHSFLVREPDA